MAVLACLASIAMTYFVMWRAPMRYSPQRLLIFSAYGLGCTFAFLIGGLLVGLLLEFAGYPPSLALVTLFRRAVSAIAVLSMLNAACQVTRLMLSSMIHFHKQHNAANLDRNPVKFVIEREHSIASLTRWVWFLGALPMWYGCWFG